ncbi:unnamed protein product, partial [Prorocentrum cordatum]
GEHRQVPSGVQVRASVREDRRAVPGPRPSNGGEGRRGARRQEGETAGEPRQGGVHAGRQDILQGCQGDRVVRQPSHRAERADPKNGRGRGYGGLPRPHAGPLRGRLPHSRTRLPRRHRRLGHGGWQPGGHLPDARRQRVQG